MPRISTTNRRLSNCADAHGYLGSAVTAGPWLFSECRVLVFRTIGAGVIMVIDLVQLRTFVAVAEEQHLTRAAERLHMSQSAASAHVRAIEERLGTQLFVRTNRSLEPTRACELLLAKATTLLNDAT